MHTFYQQYNEAQRGVAGNQKVYVAFCNLNGFLFVPLEAPRAISPSPAESLRFLASGLPFGPVSHREQIMVRDIKLAIKTAQSVLL